MFVETRFVSLESVNLLCNNQEKPKDLVWFVFWWRSANERVGCEWWGRSLVGMVMQVGNLVGMGGIGCMEVSVGCEKQEVTHGA